MPRFEKTMSTSESERGERLVRAQEGNPAGSLSHLKEGSRRKAVTSLTVLVPTYNERYRVETRLRRLQVQAESPLLERIKIVVIDDGSSDGTAEVLARCRVTLEGEEVDPKLSWVWERHGNNCGKGAAILTSL